MRTEAAKAGEQSTGTLRASAGASESAEEVLQKVGIDYGRLLGSNDDVVFLLDHRGSIVFMHQFSEKGSGTSDSFVGLHFLDVVSPKDHERVRGCLDKAMTGAEIPPYEVEYASPDGRCIVLEFETKPIFDGNKVIGLQGISRNITERKMAQERLSSLSSALEQSGEPIAITDLDGNPLYLNESFARMHGYCREDLLRQNLSVLSPSGKTSLTTEPRLKEEGESLGEIWRVRKNGSVFPALARSSLLRGQEGLPIGIIGTLRDMSELKQSQEELRKANENLEQRVQDHANRLEMANERFLNEVRERKRIEKQLKVKATNLEEMNSALKVLLKKRQEDKMALEEKVLANMRQLVELYLEKLKHTKLDESQKAFVGIIETNLKDITSEFSHKLTSSYLNLTPTELQVADLIKQGRNTKEIADIMNVSWTTVKGHRGNIRTKLKLKNKKANLRSYLLSLP